MTTWLVLGAGGLLGRELTTRPVPARVVATCHADVDVTDPAALRAVFAAHHPDVVINCAAYTAVDSAERDCERARLVNATGPRLVAEACADHCSRLVQVSTDYVFDGETAVPYSETSPCRPRTVYGRTKLAGERAVLDTLPGSGVVIRTAWLYGRRGRSFVRTMLDAAHHGRTVDVVDDQVGSPTWAADLSDRITLLASSPDAQGVFHGTNSGEASRYQLAVAVYTESGADPGRVRPVRTQPGSTSRPAYTALAQHRWHELGAGPLRHWRAALRDALPHLPLDHRPPRGLPRNRGG